MKRVLVAAVILLYLLHNDLWLWDDASIIFGLPIGLLYHVIYCVACAGLMCLLVRYAWPAGLDSSEGDGEAKSA